MVWWQREPIILEHEGVQVVRDDLVEGGTKIRFISEVVGDAKEVVYGGPCCGGAAYALSVWGKYTGTKITLFYAQRNNWHWKQKLAQLNGAQIAEVPAGRINVVQHRARTYAEAKGALLLPLGFDTEAAANAAIEVMHEVRQRTNDPQEVWCATGSGMLARCLGLAFPKSSVFGVAVGLASKHASQDMPRNVRLLKTELQFDERCQMGVPFPCDKNYEAKAWGRLKFRLKVDKRPRRILFWNVAGNNPANDEE